MKIQVQTEVSLHHLMHGISSLTTEEKVKFIMTIVRENPGDFPPALLKELQKPQGGCVHDWEDISDFFHGEYTYKCRKCDNTKKVY